MTGKCSSKQQENFEIVSVDYPKYLNVREQSEINVKISCKNRLIPDHFKLRIYQGNNLVFETSEWVEAMAAYETALPVSFNDEGTYPFNVSLIDCNVYPFRDECEDFKDFNIKVLREGEHKEEAVAKEYMWLIMPLIALIGLGIMIVRK